jgi:hypothetical protein
LGEERGKEEVEGRSVFLERKKKEVGKEKRMERRWIVR